MTMDTWRLSKESHRAPRSIRTITRISHGRERCFPRSCYRVAAAAVLLLGCKVALVFAQDGDGQPPIQQPFPGGGGNFGGSAAGSFGGVSNGNSINGNESNNESHNASFISTPSETAQSGAVEALPVGNEELPISPATEEDYLVPVQSPFPTTVPVASPPTSSTAEQEQPLPSSGLPEFVDINECRKRLQVVDADRDSLMNEEEFVHFVQQVAAHVDPTLPPSDMPSRDVWGNSLRDMPRGVRLLYNDLNQGGVIEIVGYRANQVPKPTLAQELFLVKVCVHTEIVVHQILQQHAQSGSTMEEINQEAILLPSVEVVTVYSSIALSNRVGITKVNLEPDTSHNRKGLELAYQSLVTHVVGEELGVVLTDPTPQTARNGAGGREVTRGRRWLTVAFDQQFPEIYRIDDAFCPDASPSSSTELQTKWCQVAFGKFLLYLVAENSLEVFNDYSRAVQDATESGDLQEILDEVAPDVEIKVTGAGESILPSASSEPIASPTNLTSPNLEPDSVPESDEPDDRETKLGMIFSLAVVLMSVNCCIMGVSIYVCYRNRTDRDDDFYEDHDDIDQSYEKSRQSLRRSKTGRRSSSESYFAEESSSLSAPSLHDIAAANTQTPAPYSLQDAQERERILNGQTESRKESASSSPVAAPTREEIQATLTAASTSGSSSLTPPTSRVDAGEMA